jgi:hypothetical protein
MKDHVDLLVEAQEIHDTWLTKNGGYAKDMTLRDHFAGRAMQIYMADKELIDLYCHLERDVKQEVVVTAYTMADAMLKASGK